MGQTKDYNIGICCFSANHKALKSQALKWDFDFGGQLATN
jgi:hypothetical protein